MIWPKGHWQQPCTHPTGPTEICGAMPTKAFLPGRRCQNHTPARLAGRPEPGQTAYRIERVAPTPTGDTAIDRKAVESGKSARGRVQR